MRHALETSNYKGETGMRVPTALRIYVFLIAATAARGDDTWGDIHQKALQSFHAKELEKAETLFRKSTELAQGPREVGTAANDLGVLLHVRGRDAEAKQWLNRSLAEWQQTGSREAAARTAHALGSVQRELGEYREAEITLRSALDLKPADNVTVAMLRNILADLWREQGKFVEARAATEATLATADLPWRLKVDAAVITADIDRETRQFAASIAGWSTALSEAREHEDAILEAVALRGLSEAQLAAGDAAAAEPSLRKALVMFEARNDSHQIAATLTCMAELYISTNKLAMAEEVLGKAVALDQEALGPAHPQLAALLQMRADAASRQGAYDRARVDLDRAWVIVKDAFGADSAVGGAFLANRGIIEQRAGNMQAAAGSYEKAISILRGGGPEVAGMTTVLREKYAAVLKSLNRKNEAKAVLAEARSFR
ncbi:MAG: protein of unknown function, TPR-like [Bryobacterales bacterium]|nr:protein of unknown function, TPR-like [Bryobacterales bacterium]